MTTKKQNSAVGYATYCSKEKSSDSELCPAIERYKSERIQNVAKRAKKAEVELYILSGKFGLIRASQSIPDYDHLLVNDEVPDLVRMVKAQLSFYQLSRIVFYTYSTEQDPKVAAYQECIKQACKVVEVELVIEGLNITTST